MNAAMSTVKSGFAGMSGDNRAGRRTDMFDGSEPDQIAIRPLYSLTF